MASKKKALWRIFSKYIRLRDTDDQGLARCISCGKYIQYGSSLHAGHYYPRSTSYASLYFNEKNVNSQCVHCNHYLEGNKQGYARGLLRKYGPDVLDELELTKVKKAYWDFGTYELLIKDYSARVREMGKTKKFEV